MKRRGLTYFLLLTYLIGLCAVTQKNLLPIQPNLWYKPDSVLFNPCVIDSIDSPTKYTVIMVYQTLQPDTAQPLWKISQENGIFYEINTQGLSLKEGTQTIGKSLKTSKPCIYTMQHCIESDTAYHKMDKLFIGANDNTRSSQINLYEFAYFDTRLKHRQLLMFQTYLALKYGITLDHSHYISTTGDTLWNAKTDALYYHNIKGFGKDDVYNFSTTENVSLEDSIISILYTDTLPNNTYALVGHDEGTLEWHAYEGNTTMLQRTWLLRLTGILPSIRICLVQDKIAEIDNTSILVILNEDNEIIQCFSPDSIDSEQHVYYTYTNPTTRSYFSFVSSQENINPKRQVSNKEFATPSSAINLAPNPTHGLFTLSIDLPAEENLLLTIQDPTGKIILHQTFYGISQFQYKGDISTKGTYLITTRTIQGKILSTKELIVY